MQMMKNWKTMKDERVRPSGKAKGKSQQYDHRKTNGIAIPVDEEFTLPSGAKAIAPGQSGVAGEDIHCRCYLSYGLQRASESDIIKETRMPREVYEAQNITLEIVEEIQNGINEIEREYQVKLEGFKVEDVGIRLPDTPYFVRYLDNNGLKEVEFVINSGYSDAMKNGFETLAESFVRMRNGEPVSEAAEQLVRKHIERWRKE